MKGKRYTTEEKIRILREFSRSNQAAWDWYGANETKMSDGHRDRASPEVKVL